MGPHPGAAYGMEKPWKLRETTRAMSGVLDSVVVVHKSVLKYQRQFDCMGSRAASRRAAVHCVVSSVPDLIIKHWKWYMEFSRFAAGLVEKRRAAGKLDNVLLVLSKIALLLSQVTSKSLKHEHDLLEGLTVSQRFRSPFPELISEADRHFLTEFHSICHVIPQSSVRQD